MRKDKDTLELIRVNSRESAMLMWKDTMEYNFHKTVRLCAISVSHDFQINARLGSFLEITSEQIFLY